MIATLSYLALPLGTILAVSMIELGARRLDARKLALLAALAAIDSGLRLALVQGIAGFTPIFFLVLCAGYVFGAGFGFLTGATSMLVSALVTGGVGPWLPSEVLGMALVGGAAGLLRGPRPTRRLGLAALAGLGIVTGFGYGAFTDAWEWVYWRGSPDLAYAPGMSAAVAAGHFVRYYLATSLAWDSFRAGGNALMVLALARPVVAALERFRARFTFTVVPASEVPGSEMAARIDSA